MKLTELELAIAAHSGEFLCEEISDPASRKSIAFRHRIEPPQAGRTVPPLPGLQDFYDTFGSVLFYADAHSGEAAILVAAPGQWDTLHAHFSAWTGHLDDREREEYLPDWVDEALVVGEEPHTGNYLLIPTTGENAGHVVLFDHDGFDFLDLAPDLPTYAKRLLAPDDAALTMMATHMRFIEDGSSAQWWIREMHDNLGNSARTSE